MFTPKSVKSWILVVLLLLIAAGAVVYQFDLVDIMPDYLEPTVLAADGGSAAAGAGSASTTAKLGTGGQSTVAIVQAKRDRTEDITYEDIKAMVVQAVTLAGGFNGVIKEGQTAGTALAQSFADCTVSIDGVGNTATAKYITLYTYDKFLNCGKTIVQVIRGSGTVVDDGDYAAPRAEKTPEIDGVGNDACWAKAAWKSIACSWDYFLSPPPDYPQPADFNGRYKIVWTPGKLYYLIEITDDKLVDTHANPLENYWDDDCVELFLDEDHSGGNHQSNYNAFAYHIGLDYTAVDLTDNGEFAPGIFSGHIKAMRSKNGDVYTWEIAVDIYSDSYQDESPANTPVTLQAGKVMGFAIAYCDSDSYWRDNFIGSIKLPRGEDTAWQDADVFGTLTLVD